MRRDPYRYYRVEARDLIEALSRGTLGLSRAASRRAAVGELLRLAHTLKGASRIVKQLEIAELAHEVEEVLLPFREGDALPSREQVDAVLLLLDRAGANLSALDRPAALGGAPPRGGEPAGSVRVPVEELDHVVRGVFEAGVQARGMRQTLAGIEGAGALARSLREQLASPRFAEARATAAGRRLLSLSEELHEALERARRELASGLEHTEAELAQVRDGIDQLRLLPAGGVFSTLERAVRDAAAELEKPVAFEASGAEVKLDAHVLRALRDAMLHAVRNAVAHGIEPPAEREARGKPPEGRVSVAFERRGSRVAFVCADDGRGIDAPAVMAEARRRGLVPDGEPVDAQQAVALLFRGGLSTSDRVTGVSGRGIGLDVVRETARRLEGEASIRTEPGRGTAVEICVPVSLSSARALFVEAGGAPVGVPLDAVRRTLLLDRESVARSGDAESIAFDGEVLPFASLARLLGRSPVPHSPTLPPQGGGQGGGASAARRRSSPAVVVGAGGRSAALAIERLLGVAEVVVRRLPPIVQAEPFVAGAALDADGTPRLVLEPAALVAAAAGLPRAADEPVRPRPRLLVVDDSLTTRMLEQSILESAGYEVELASSGEEALEKARRSRFDAFLVDVEMPGMDGFELIRLSHEDPLMRGTPSILVTSRSSPEDRRRGVEVGARAYIAKGEFEQGALLEHIRNLVR